MSKTIVFGRNQVLEAIASGHLVNRVYISRDAPAELRRAVREALRGRATDCDVVPPEKLRTIAKSDAHQGLVASISPIEYRELKECLANSDGVGTLLAVDEVENPRNLGQLIRVGAGAGVKAVLIGARGGALVDEEVVQASAGTVFRVPIVRCGNLPTALRQCRDANYWIVGLDGQAEKSIFDFRWPDRAVLVVGNETEGLRHVSQKACDELVRIPLAEGVESLNVSSAASAALFLRRAWEINRNAS